MSTDVNAAQRFFSIAEVAAMFGRSPRTVRFWIAKGRLKVVRIGRMPFVPENELPSLDAEDNETPTQETIK